MAGRTEANILNDCLIALAEAGHLVWRQNTGVLKDANGRPIKFGLCKGSSDIIGLTKGGVFLAVECKTATGRVRPEQEHFILAVRRKMGYAGVARSAEDALRIANGEMLS